MANEIRSTPVILQKLAKNSTPIVGRLMTMPRKGASLIVEFLDGKNEYVTSAIVRIFYVVTERIFYIETTNSRYKLIINNEESK